MEKIQQAELDWFFSDHSEFIEKMSSKLTEVLDSCQTDFDTYCTGTSSNADRRRKLTEFEARSHPRENHDSLFGREYHWRGRSEEGRFGIPEMNLDEKMKNAPHHKKGLGRLPGDHMEEMAYQRVHSYEKYHPPSFQNLYELGKTANGDERTLDNSKKMMAPQQQQGEEGGHHGDFHFHQDHHDHHDHDHHHDHHPNNHHDHHHYHSMEKEEEEGFDLDIEIELDDVDFEDAPLLGFGYEGDKCLLSHKKELSDTCHDSVKSMKDFMEDEAEDEFEEEDEDEFEDYMYDEGEPFEALFEPPFIPILAFGMLTYLCCTCSRRRRRRKGMEEIMSVIWGNDGLRSAIEQQVPTQALPLPKPPSEKAKRWRKVLKVSLVLLMLMLGGGLITASCVKVNKEDEEENDYTALHILAILMCIDSVVVVISLFYASDLCCAPSLPPVLRRNMDQQQPLNQSQQSRGENQYIALTPVNSYTPPSVNNPLVVQPNSQQNPSVTIYTGVPISGTNSSLV